MNPEMHKGPERTPENKLEQSIEELEMSLLLNKNGFTSVEDLPFDVMDRVREIAARD